MPREIEAALHDIGGDELVTSWRQAYGRAPAKPLPTAYADTLSVGYAVALGTIATAVDLILDQAFRAEMAETHRLLSSEEQAKLEETIKKRLKELGYYPEDLPNDPKMAMDWYRSLNDELGLNSPFRLRPANHRILNHTGRKSVIEMLMKGEAGFGNLRRKIYPTMSEADATELFELHIAADRGSPASVPLRIMSWLWEQSIRSQAGDKVGGPNPVFALLERFGPQIDWARWCNRFFGENLVPQGASIGEAMLKLYEKGAPNERVFWTSNLGAPVGGFKRRCMIAATLELGIEIFALFEGVRLGFVNWESGPGQMTASYLEWRDQPKYLNMRIIAQAAATTGPTVRAVLTGDVLGLNLASTAMTVKHLCDRRGVGQRHTERLVQFSYADTARAVRSFEAETGISLTPTLKLVVDNGKIS